MKEWVQTDDGSYTLMNNQYNETYHSRSGAWAECQEVFLKPFLGQKELCRSHHWKVLDVGFGLGLNWLSYVNSFLHRVNGSDTAGFLKLDITSLERDPEILKITAGPQTLGCYPVHNRGIELLHLLKKDLAVETDKIQAKIIIGEATESLLGLSRQNKKFNVILQDPFSPQKNPECWDNQFFKLIASCCEQGSVLMTYSVAREVRNCLGRAGFEVNKVKGFGQKREQLVAIYHG